MNKTCPVNEMTMEIVVLIYKSQMVFFSMEVEVSERNSLKIDSNGIELIFYFNNHLRELTFVKG